MLLLAVTSISESSKGMLAEVFRLVGGVFPENGAVDQNGMTAGHHRFNKHLKICAIHVFYFYCMIL
ncbi:MAG: hypothetical protein CMP07_04340 [Xanthomonadales bacterium]|nr:hypothetical protein [Xanthomonadales bacterium]